MKKNSEKSSQRKSKSYGTGLSDGLVPLKPLNVSDARTVSDLVEAMKYTAFSGRSLGEAADVLEEMTRDKSCFKVLTLSGAMTVAKMSNLICDMIDSGMVDAVVSTGALMAHGFVESNGMMHFKHNLRMSDEALYKKGYNRVYDTLEPEENLNQIDLIVRSVYSELKDGEEVSSSILTRKFGEYLVKNTPKNAKGVLKSAFLKGVPVYIPAFSDSEIGLDFGIYRRKKISEGKKPAIINQFLDLEDYTARVLASKNLGIFTIGGGVPRNWAQQVGPYLDIINHRLGTGGGFKRFHYAVRVCPEPVHWGGLSGCTYSEGVSWGKFVPQSEGGRQVEVYSDATIAWPFIVKAVMERLEKTPLKK